MQGGSYCFCGMSYGSQGNVSQPSWCNHKCTGNPGQTCGGNHRGSQSAGSVFRRNSPSLDVIGVEMGSSAVTSFRNFRNPIPLHRPRKKERKPKFSMDAGLARCYSVPSCAAPPESVDWSQRGVVTPARDQKECDASWAFAAVGAVESASAIASGKLVPLSPQNLLDCGWRYGANSCKGIALPLGLIRTLTGAII